MKKLSILFLMVHIVLFHKSIAQSTANYTFSTATNGSLEDMSSGTSQLVASSLDQSASPVTNIGFDFYLMGNRYTQFSASSNGIIQLGSTAVSNGTYVTSGGSVTSPKISAFGGDLQTGSAGKVHSKVIGTAPNRTLVVEFLNMNLYYVSSVFGNDATYQVHLSETTGEIKFIYGTMTVSSTSGAADASPSIGFSTNATSNNVLSVNLVSHTVNTTTFTENATSTVGAITSLTSSSNGSRRVYSFTPPAAPTAPTWVAPTNVLASAMTLNWTDNASNEIGYLVFRSTDNVTFTQQGTLLAANTTTVNVTGLTLSTLYYWKIQAVREGTFGEATGSQTTTGLTVYTWSVASGNWNTSTSWTPNRTTPDITDVLVFDGNTQASVTVTYDVSSTQTVSKLSVINNATVTFNASASGKTLTIGNSPGVDFEVLSGSTFTMGTNSPAINFTASGGNTVNIDGTLGITTGTLTTSSSTTVITTVNGTVNYSVGSTFSGSSSSLIFSAGSNYNHSFSGTSGGTIPTASWNTTSTITVLAPIASTATSIGGITGTFGNFVWNCANQNGNLGMATATGTTFNSFTMQASGATSNTRFSGSSVTINIGTLNVTGGSLMGQSSTNITTIVATNFNQSGGTFDLTNSTSGNCILKVSNTFNRTAGTFTRSGLIAATAISGSSNGSYIEFNGTSAQTPVLGTLTNQVGIGINNTAGVTLTTTINDGANVWMTSGAITGTITYTNSTLKNGIIYNGIIAQTATTAELPSVIGRLTINNPAGLSIPNDITLNEAGSSNSSLSLTSGIITMGTGKTLTITGTGVTLPTGSSTSFVNLAAAGSGYEVTTTTSSTRNFPVGVGTTSNDFRRVVLTSLNQNGTTKVQIIAGSGGTASGTGIQALSTTRRYLLTSTGTFTSFGSISIMYGTDDNLGIYAVGNLRIGQSATLGGTYNNLGPATGTTSPLISTSGPYTSLGHFALGANETSANIFNGTINNNWSEAGNWSLGTIPTCGIKALIEVNKICNVDINNAVANELSISGTLNINSSTSNITVGRCAANENNSSLIVNTSGTLNVSDGVLNVNGRFEISTGGFFVQSNGSINVDGNGSTNSVASPNAIVQLIAANSSYTLSGGTFTIIDPGATTSLNSFSYTGTGSYICTGTHTFRFGDGTSTQAGTTDGFILNNTGARFNFRNLIINGGNAGMNRFVRQSFTDNSIIGTMTINANSEYRSNTYSLYLAGDLINNGRLVSDGTSSDALRFENFSNGTETAVITAQTVSGSGTFANAISSSTASATLMAINNTSTSGVTFQTNFSVSGTLTHIAGIINMGANTLTIGVSTSSAGTWTYTAGRVLGKVKKWFSSTIGTSAIVFPIGDNGINRNATINFANTSITTGGTLTASFNTGLPAGPNITPAAPQTINGQLINSVSPTGFWQIDAGDGFNIGSNTYTASFNASGFTGTDGTTAIAGVTDLRLIKRNTAAADWTDPSATSTTANPSALSTVAITGQNSFSIFALAGINAALPVTLKSFTATERGSVNVVNWETETEENVRSFVIEKSVDGKNWSVLGTTSPRADKRYTMNDLTPNVNTYYRLRNIDNDGREEESNIIVVNRKTGKFNVTSVAPNPTAENLNIKFETTENTSIMMSLVDLMGRVVLSKSFESQKGFNTVTLETISIPTGTYFLVVNNGTDKITERIVKQ